MRTRKTGKLPAAFFVCAACLFLLFPSGGRASAIDYDGLLERLDSYKEGRTYLEYCAEHPEAARPADAYVIEAGDYVDAERMVPERYEDFAGKEGQSVFTGEEGLITYRFDCKTAGFYNIEIEYYPVEGKSSTIERAVLIDGALPYAESALVQLPRVWQNDEDAYKRDNQGNDLRPKQVEAPCWRTQYLYDSEGFHTDPLLFYFSEGVHTLSFFSQREPMVIRRITVANRPALAPYAAYAAAHAEKGYAPAKAQPLVIEAESAQRKSSPMLYPVCDHSTPAISPYSAKAIRNNAIGGENWRIAGDWIEWDIEAPEDGLYTLAFWVKQNFVRGTYSARRFFIDGEVPFAEMNEVVFAFARDYRYQVLSDETGRPYQFYLSKGAHTLRLEVTLGSIADVIREMEGCILMLNDIYRSVLMITGTEPDFNRDYQIARRIPGIEDTLLAQKALIDRHIVLLEEIAGQRSDKEAILITMSAQLQELARDIEDIPRKQKDFKTNIGALSTWVMRAKEQPLQIDRIYLAPDVAAVETPRNAFIDTVKHEASILLNSFLVDYNSIGNVTQASDQRSITVWVGAGRDQAVTIKSLIDETFTKETGINVNLMNVDMSTLLSATLAGQGPDVAMQVAADVPMNYAMRNAALDISGFPEFERVKARFNENALVPFTFEDRCYALPETQSFSMLFYRKDILGELGLTPPRTWGEVKAALSVLSNNYMTFAMMPSDLTFGMFLYQNGGSFYTPDAKASAIDSDTGVNAFKEYTAYYTDYRLEREFDFANRFRTGEMPLGIADISLYNTLQVFAPEIKGLWSFTTVPGTERDGAVDNTVPSYGLGIMILKNTKDPDAAWEFIKWWTDTEAQIQYARELEGLMGSAARYPTANLEAFSLLPWPTADYQRIMAQYENIRGVPQVPGGYFTGRHINNAFYTVVLQRTMEPREALMEYVRYINDEITYKRKEFGLP